MKSVGPSAVFALALALALVPATPVAADCDTNGIPDECDLDCGAPGGACDVPGCGTASDCDADTVPDVCQLTAAAMPCSFPMTLLDNGTTDVDATFLGPPDDIFFGIGGQIVTWEVGCGFAVDGPGSEITVYEVDNGGVEFGSIDVLASLDGITFFSLKTSETGMVRIPGDQVHGDNRFARSYDLAASGLGSARYIRLDGNGTGASGTTSGFDLDAIGIVTAASFDCDASGVLDACEALQDCDADGIPETCEMALGTVADCDSSGTADSCDTLGGANDCNGDGVPDACEPDCNGNVTPDACDLIAMTSADCNGNAVPDECDLLANTVSLSGSMAPVGSGATPTFTLLSPFPAASDVTVTVSAASDLGATNEYLDFTVNAVPLTRLFETTGQQCTGTQEIGVADADAFNLATGGISATAGLLAPSAVDAFECSASHATVTLSYTPIVDCNGNGALDYCDIAGALSTDANLNGIADDCEVDCNGNMLPDDFDIAQGTSLDCNANAIPDECDIAGGASIDCNVNAIPDECEVDCNANSVPDECDITLGTSTDCDLNTIPDDCDLVYGLDGCSFPQLLLSNGTNASDDIFTGAPDGTFYGLGGQVVTYEFDCGFIADGPGADFTVYEVSSGSPEFDSLEDVEVSADGVVFVSVQASESPAVRIPGDELHTNDSFARSYDLFATGLNAVRFVRLDGVGTGASSSATGFDLDAIGAVNRSGLDCDASGILDRCETFFDCNANALPDHCELSAGIGDDCNNNAQLDTCDINLSVADDVDADWIPDSCEPDCNTNLVPDHYDIEQGTSTDCNNNLIPDECDLSAGTSLDCNTDMLPDECPICPTVEVVFIMDTSSSMNGEGSALCASVQQVVAELQADLVNVNVELLGLLETGGASFSCLTDHVANLYGTAVPGSPPAGQDTLGTPCGVNLNEDWALATSIVAGLKPWQADSVRLIVPISDEGPRCGDPVNDPGDDRDATLHAIGQAQLNNVIVSPISGDGSSQGVLNMMDLIAGATNGQAFSSTDPGADIPAGIRDIVLGACDNRGDCNDNDVPDSCDLVNMTSQDCDMSGAPDECEADCNLNGLHDSCDIATMTSADTNANTVPDECEGIVLLAGPTDWEWTPVTAALGYDLIGGELNLLTGFAGDYGLVTHQCLANDTAGVAWPFGADPGPGEQLYFLVRAVMGTGPLSYDTFGPGLVAGRDGGIAASGTGCP